MSMMAKLESVIGHSLRSFARKVSLWSLSSRSTTIDESLIRVIVFEAGFPSMGVDPKSICSSYILKLGKIAVALIGMSMFFDPLTTIVITASILHGLSELTLKMIYEAYSAAMLPFLGEGTMIPSYSFGILILYMVGTFDKFLRCNFCSYCFPMETSPKRISCVLQTQLLSGITALHFTYNVFPYFNLSLKTS